MSVNLTSFPIQHDIGIRRSEAVTADTKHLLSVLTIHTYAKKQNLPQSISLWEKYENEERVRVSLADRCKTIVRAPLEAPSVEVQAAPARTPAENRDEAEAQELPYGTKGNDRKPSLFMRISLFKREKLRERCGAKRW